MKDINKKFSVRYYLNLVLMDTEERRYFKQQEITLWRKGDKQRKQNLQSPGVMAGTQNFNSEQQKQKELESGDDFIKAAPNSHSSESFNSDGSEQKQENQIQSMTRETTEDNNQKENNSEVPEDCSE